MNPLHINTPATSRRREYNIRLIVGVVLAVLLLGGIIAVIIYTTTHRNTGSNDNDSCISGPGYEAAKSYFRNPANNEKVTISTTEITKVETGYSTNTGAPAFAGYAQLILSWVIYIVYTGL